MAYFPFPSLAAVFHLQGGYLLGETWSEALFLAGFVWYLFLSSCLAANYAQLPAKDMNKRRKMTASMYVPFRTWT